MKKNNHFCPSLYFCCLQVLQPPATYVPIRTPARKLTATPTPMMGQTPSGFYMQQENLDKSAKFVDNQPKGQVRHSPKSLSLH